MRCLSSMLALRQDGSNLYVSIPSLAWQSTEGLNLRRSIGASKLCRKLIFWLVVHWVCQLLLERDTRYGNMEIRARRALEVVSTTKIMPPSSIRSTQARVMVHAMYNPP